LLPLFLWQQHRGMRRAAIGRPTARTHVLKLAKAKRYAGTGEGMRIRLAHGLSLQDIADGVGVGVTTLWRWENGRNAPRSGAGARWADLLDELEAQDQGSPVGAA
jgi:DNA-binding transcriptional regulator YiaG